MKKSAYKKSSTQKYGVQQLLELLPIIIFVCITPLLVKLHLVVYENIDAPWNSNSLSTQDLFNYYKSVSIILSGIISGIYLAFIALRNKSVFKIKGIVWPILALTAVIIVSSIFSNNPKISMLGMINRHEGALVWLCYITNFLYIAYYIKNTGSRTLVYRGLLFSGLVIGSIGALQYLGFDIFKNTLFQHLYLPKEQIGKLTFTFEQSRVYSTLFNPNYVAQYVSMMLPLSVVMIYADTKNLYKSLWAILSIEMIVCLIGSEGRGGLLGIGAAVFGLVIILLLNKMDKPQWGAIVLSIIVLTGGIGFSWLATTDKIFPQSADNAMTELKDVSIKDNVLNIKYRNGQFKFEFNEEVITAVPDLFDENNRKLETKLQRDGFWALVDSNFDGIKYGIANLENGQFAYLFVIDNNNWVFQKTDSGIKYINQYGEKFDLVEAKSIGFKGNEKVGSNRGYIWSRTLPLILASPVLGHGADSFSLIFPQGEFLIKQQIYGQNYIMVDKPHNMYLQVLLEFGVIGFIALMALVINSVTSGINSIIKREKHDKWAIIAVLVAIFGFMGAGLFYDSNVNVSPVFWVLLSLAAADVFKPKEV